MFAEKFAPRLSSIPATESQGRLIPDISVPQITLDRAQPSDEPFLYRTFASTRAEEVALTGWNPEQQETFLRTQYEAQRSSYLVQVPDAEYWVIRFGESAVGRLIIHETPQEIHVVDIALLPEFRKQGIGSTLMKAIMKEAAQAAKAVGLYVERFNPALHWYERLGFGVAGSGPIYLEMVWRAARTELEPDVQEPSLGVAYAGSSH
jgi:ribosomal protein S18 acetylase RimI-like enzyme